MKKCCVSAGAYHTVGLKSDGTVVAAGTNQKGECLVSDWTNVTAISAGYYRTIALTADRTFLSTGSLTPNEKLNLS